MANVPGVPLLLLLLSLHKMVSATGKPPLRELPSESYASSLAPGRTALLYFTNAELSNNGVFVEELEKSAELLEDYGVHVAKVICGRDDPVKFCAEGSAYLFKGTKLLRAFPTDTLFDVNAIVANVLFVLLYNKVKYIASILELHNIEGAEKGKRNVIFTYVQAIGTPEHRTVMEAAFIHGSTHQFVLSTEASVLKSMSSEEPSQVSAKLFFIHCKSVTEVSQQCRRTVLERPLTTLNIHRFLKLMALPLVGEASGDPDKFTSVHLQLGLPVIFILSQQETYDIDLETAEETAWQLLGKAGVTMLLREKSGVHIPSDMNVAVKTAAENSPVKYIRLENIQQIHDLLLEMSKEKKEKPKEEQGDPEVQDDEVAQTVHQERKLRLPLHLVPELTDKTFKMAPSSPRHMAVLFYMSWDPVSQTVLKAILKMVEKYKDLLDVSLARVNCADWTDVCQKENVTSIPVIKIYQAGQQPFLYPGMLGTDELADYLMLMKLECPLRLRTEGELEDYLCGRMEKPPLPPHHASLLGIFSPDMERATEDFIHAGKELRGFARVAIYTGERTAALAEKHGVRPPAVLFSRCGAQKMHAVSLHDTPAGEIPALLRWKSLGELPEVRVETLPTLLERQRPLLLMFSEGPLPPSQELHMLSLVREGYLQPYSPGWLNLKETPEGYEVLQKYFGLVPHLPALVLVTFGTRGQVFAFPADQPITEVNVLFWLEMIKAGEESPVYTLLNDDWGAPLPDYDFLAMMDAADPNLAAQKIRIKLKPRKRQKVELATDDATAECPSRRNLRGTVPKFLDSEEAPEPHTEL